MSWWHARSKHFTARSWTGSKLWLDRTSSQPAWWATMSGRSWTPCKLPFRNRECLDADFTSAKPVIHILTIYFVSMLICSPLDTLFIFVIYFILVLRKVCARNKEDYDKNVEFKRLMLKHMALCTLPANQIVPVFQQLKQEVLHLQPLRLRKQVQIMHRNYFQKFWFQGIGPQLISTYGLAHKTNNVCESLHKK